MPKAFRFGAEVAEGVIFSLIADYFSGKILQYFKRRALRSSLADLEPEINDYKQVALDSSPPEIRRAIEHPVWPNIRQFYWVITIRLRTTTVVGVRAPTVSSTQPHLVSVAIAEKERSGRSGVHQGKTVVAPAQHPVIMLQDSETVTYSRPIVSWGVVYTPCVHGLPVWQERARPRTTGRSTAFCEHRRDCHYRWPIFVGEGEISADVCRSQLGKAYSVFERIRRIRECAQQGSRSLDAEAAGRRILVAFLRACLKT